MSGQQTEAASPEAAGGPGSLQGRGKLARVWRGLSQERHWALALVHQSLDQVLSGAQLQVTLLEPAAKDVMWADPFPVRDAAGNLWVFVEELPRWRGVGRIVALRIEGAEVAQRVVVLQGQHHYSFPQAQLSDGTWIATAETCDLAAPTYTFGAPGEAWTESMRVLPPGVIDPAVAIGGPGETDAWYLAGTPGSDVMGGYRQWQGEGGAAWEAQPELSYSDARLGRGAGNADLSRGLRSVQDCSENYGIATAVVRWDPAEPGPGEVLRRLTGTDLSLGALGTHTLSWTPDGETVVADVWRRRRQNFSVAHRLLEQRHGQLCPGRRASRQMP